MLGGSTQLTELAPGIYGGDLSGIAARTAPRWVRPLVFPAERPCRHRRLGGKDGGAGAGLAEREHPRLRRDAQLGLLFLDKLAALRPEAGRRLAGLYPDLELFAHGGVNSRLPEHLRRVAEGQRAETRELYAGKRGLHRHRRPGDGEGLRMIIDNGLFYEFVPVEELDAANPTRHWLANAETGVNYALVLSTCAGLWSYVVGDTVRIVDRDPPRILVTGRTSYMLSAFGEHLIGEEIEKAVAAAAAAIGACVSDFSVGAIFPRGEGELGGHLYIVEFADGAPSRTGSPNSRACWTRPCAR